MAEPITVFLMDDHEVVRQGVRALLESTGEIEVVASELDGVRTGCVALSAATAESDYRYLAAPRRAAGAPWRASRRRA